jgi:hypothetical protein
MNKHRLSFHRKITIKYSVSPLLEWRREKVSKKLQILLPRRQTSGKLIKNHNYFGENCLRRYHHELADSRKYTAAFKTTLLRNGRKIVKNNFEKT